MSTSQPDAPGSQAASLNHRSYIGQANRAQCNEFIQECQGPLPVGKGATGKLRHHKGMGAELVVRY